MKAKFTVVILVLISNLVFSQVNQSALSKAKHAMALKDYNSAINWGLTDMSNQPSRYTAYLLAYAYFQVNKYDKAAYYGGISIGDQIIIPGETINNVKKGQLKQIVDYYAKLNNFNQQQITSTLYSHYVNKESIIINFSLSEGQNTTHNLDLEGAKQQQRQRDSTLQARHVSLITLSGGSNPESARGFL
ncbi:MAG: hypothetical protein JWR09_4250, partial [Mucilaginibacter sp.]|nr:hypothetical protein [Mucilaginibacter sp.]